MTGFVWLSMTAPRPNGSAEGIMAVPGPCKPCAHDPEMRLGKHHEAGIAQALWFISLPVVEATPELS